MLKKKVEKLAYLNKEGRVVDVIRLIKVLSVVKGLAYRSNKGINETLKCGPISAETWTTIGKEHPEFFRVAKTKDKNEDSDESLRISLLIRHLREKGNKEEREALEIEEIQKMVDWVLELQEKQILWNQRNNYKSRLWAGLLAGCFLLLVTFINFYNSQKQFEDIVKILEIELRTTRESNLKLIEDNSKLIENKLKNVELKVEEINEKIKK